MNNALALGIKPMQIDAATPLLTAAKLRQADTEARQSDMQMKQAAIGAEARGLVPFANRPEFPQKWAESVDRLHSQGLLDQRSYQQWRDNPSPLVLQQIIAQTSSPELQFRMEEAKRSQANANRSFGLLKQQADDAARGVDYREIDDGAGGKTLVRIEKSTGKASKVDVSGTSGAPANPFMTGGKMNEAQSKDALYASRMLNAEEVLRDPAIISAAQSAGERLKQELPGAGKYYNLNSVEYQKFDQAQRDFINATLRRESGAVISPDEFANARKQYFPAPGDSPQVLTQKAANRRTAIEGIGAGAGPGYRPNASFDESGNLVKRPKQPAKGAAITKEQYDALPPGTPYTAPDGSQRVKQ
jgi:hypothetical protein